MNERIRAALERARNHERQAAATSAEATTRADQLTRAMEQKMRDVIAPQLRSAIQELEGASGASYDFKATEIGDLSPNATKIQVTFFDQKRESTFAALTIERRDTYWRVTIGVAIEGRKRTDQVFEKADVDMDDDRVVGIIEQTIGSIYGT